MSIQERGCNQVCDDSMGLAASGFRSGIGAFLGLCKAQPDTFHRGTYLTQLEQVWVLLFLLGRGALSPSCCTGSTTTLINLTVGLQSKILFSSFLPLR